MGNRKILFVCPYPFDEAPSQRFRFEQYLHILEAKDYQYTLAPFLNTFAWRILYQSGNRFQKLFWVTVAFFKRFSLLFQLKRYTYIFIHREATPVGPPFFEWTVRYIWRKKMIYDFDDAIWLQDSHESGNLKAIIKWRTKVKDICRWSCKVSCGNEYLAQFARRHNSRVIIMPTTIDTSYHQEMFVPKAEKMVIGWTGTHSTLPYLKLVLPLLNKLNKVYDFELLIISNQQPDFNVPYIRFCKWKKSSEIEDLNQIDIGIMPLKDDTWSKGKCGFKILQYMAIRKPVIASPIGINKKLLGESNAGFAAETEAEWDEAIRKLFTDKELRSILGSNGKKYLTNYYSVEAKIDTFLALFKAD